MATTLYFRSTTWTSSMYRPLVGPSILTYNLQPHGRSPSNSTVSQFELLTTAGSSLHVSGVLTSAGPLAAPGYPAGGVSAPIGWVSPPVTSQVTISGTVTFSLHAYEQSMSANAYIGGALWVVRPNGTSALIASVFSSTELTTSSTEYSLQATPTSTTLYPGDVLLATAFFDDVDGTNMGDGYYVYLDFDSAAEDTSVTLTETVTLSSTLASGQGTMFLTGTTSDVSGAANKAITFTASGTQTTYNASSASNGEVILKDNSNPVSWYTPPLQAVTLEGYSSCSIWARTNTSGTGIAITAKVFKTDTNGANPVLIASGRTPKEIGTTDASYPFALTWRGTLTDGQRLKVELYTTACASGSQTTGNDLLVTVGYTDGETSVSLPDSVTEAPTGPTANGSLSLSGSVGTVTAKPTGITGSMTLGGSVGTVTAKPTGITGSVSLAGTANWRITSGITGSVSLAGTANWRIASGITGSVALGGSVTSTKANITSATGSVTLGGSVSTAITAKPTGITGSVSLGGTVYMGTTAAGSLSLAGSVGTVTAKPTGITGSVSLAGTANWQVASGITGSLSMSGTAAWRAPPATGSLSLSGTANWRIVSGITGSVTLGGSIGTVTAKPTGITGSLSLAGVVTGAEVNATFTTFTSLASAEGDATNFTASVSQFASVRASTGSINSSNVTSHAVTMPASVTSADLLLIIASFDGSGGTIVAPSAWTTIAGPHLYGSNNGLVIFAKIAAGNEAGTTVTWTTSIAEQSSAVALSIASWGGLLSGLIISNSTMNSAIEINPPAATAGATSDWLWIAAAGWDGNTSLTGTPTGFTQGTTVTSSSPNGAGVTFAWRQLNSSSSDPDGAWQLSSSSEYVAVTLGITTGAGNARFSTGYATATGYGDVGSGQGTANWSTLEGNAAAAGGSTTFINLTTFDATGTGAATTGGGTTTADGTATFATTAPTCTAGGETTTFFGQQSITWETLEGQAMGYGGDTEFIIPVHATFYATGSDASVAAAVSADDWIVDSTFTTSASSATATTTGTSALAGDAYVATTTTGAVAGGNAGSLKSDRYTWVTIEGSATASGRNAEFTTAVNTMVARTQQGTASATMMLGSDPFQSFVPERVNSTVATFSVEDWRVVGGLTKSEAQYAAVESVQASLGVSGVASPFVDPTQVSGISFHRWLASSYTTPDWSPITAGAPTSGSRSWDQARTSFTWSTARLRTWDQLRTSSADPTTPVWQNYGSENATKSTTYTYWRVDQYVSNNAILVKPTTSLQMVWDPGVNYPQITVALVLVPRVPAEGSYEILSANSNLRVVLNSDSTIDVVQGSDRTSTAAIAARSRPNEPIVVALSVQTSEPGSGLTWWRYHLAVMDTMVRTTTKQVSGTLSQDELNWRIGGNQDATFELLEANVYTNSMSSNELARELSVFDMIYGVTVV